MPAEPGPAPARWRARPVAGAVLRVAIVAVPVLSAWLAVVAGLQLVGDRLATQPWWLLPLALASVVVALVVERLARRLLPLAALLKLTMLFPDQAPSRFRVARATRSTDQRVAAMRQPGRGEVATAAETTLALVTALTAHDRRTRGHSERVRIYCDLLAEELHLAEDDRDRLRWASLLHDVGKLSVAGEILNKPSALSSPEWDQVRTHPARGEELAAPLLGWLGPWGGAIRHHHERFDGTGYPDGLAGEAVPMAARIVAIADSFEVMTAARSYKKAVAARTALAELARCSGSQFDPVLVRAFLAISLPRLVWATGPLAVFMNVPLLGTAIQTLTQARVSPAQLTAVAGVAIVTAGASASALGEVRRPSADPGRASVVAGASGSPSATPSPSARPSTPSVLLTPAPTPTAIRPAVTRPAPTPYGRRTPIPSPSRTPTPTPTPSPTGPPGPTPDTTAPTARIDPALRGVFVGTQVTVLFASPDPTARFRCQVDGQAEAPCASPLVLTGLSDGRHEVVVRATDPAGNTGPPARAAFETVASPVVTLTAAPPATTTSSTATFAFATDVVGLTVVCSLDGAAYVPCPSPTTFTGLPVGPHRLVARPVDAWGRPGPALQYSWLVV